MFSVDTVIVNSPVFVQTGGAQHSVLTREDPSQPQTIRCRLEGVPPAGHRWSSAATEAFRDLVTEQTVVTLRVVREDSGHCPYVELNFPDSNEGSINFDLSTEFDIFP